MNNPGLTSTPINNAFDFNSTIKSSQIQQNNISLSTTCIYCNNPESIALLQDGSFRKCTKCKKHFRPKTTLINQNKNQSQNQLSQPVSYQQPIFHTMRPIYQPNPK